MTREEYEWEPTPEPSWGIGSLLNALDWDHVRAEVEREAQARIAIVGMKGVGKSSLLNRLRGWEVSPPGNHGNASVQTSEASKTSEVYIPVEDFGLFVLIDLPDEVAIGATWPRLHNSFSGDILDNYWEATWTTLSDADLILFVLGSDAFVYSHREEQLSWEAKVSPESVGLRTAEYRWFCRIRSLGRPLIVVLNKVDLLSTQLDEIQAELERRLAASVILISSHQGTGLEDILLPRMLSACPGLAVALGREMAAVRRSAAGYLIRQGVLLSVLTGLEPVPFLDIPVQLASQMRLLLRLAALYGRLERGDNSRELLASVAGGLGVRLGAQQAAKLVPVLGWVVSGLLSGLSTWLLARAAMAYFNGWKYPDSHHMREVVRDLKARASRLGTKCTAGLAGWKDRLAFGRRSEDPSVDKGFGP